MTDRKPIFVVVDELNRPTELSEFGTDDVIPVSNGGTGATSIQAATGLVYNPTAGTLTTADDVTEFTVVGGSEKLIARHINVANDLSAGPSCETLLDGTVSISNSLSAGSNCLVQFHGTLSALSGISVSGPLSSTEISATTVDSVEASSTDFFTPDGGAFNCMGADGQKFSMKRENGATYENLIKSDEGTITIQSEDDIHFLSNTGEKFMRLNESGGDGEVELYFNNSLKLETINTGITVTGDINGMPYPAPFGYMALSANDTASTDEKKLGYSNTPTTIVSDGITWDDTNKYFVAADAGTYEVMGVVILEGGSTLVDLAIQKNGSDVLVGQPRVHSTVDPLEHTIRAVFTMTAGQNANITYDATASNSVKAITGSTMTIKRLA